MGYFSALSQCIVLKQFFVSFFCFFFKNCQSVIFISRSGKQVKKNITAIKLLEKVGFDKQF